MVLFGQLKYSKILTRFSINAGFITPSYIMRLQKVEGVFTCSARFFEGAYWNQIFYDISYRLDSLSIPR